MMHRFAYLRHALAALLVFIGGKVIVAAMLGRAKIPLAISLSVTLATLAAGVLGPLWLTRLRPSAIEAGAGGAGEEAA